MREVFGLDQLSNVVVKVFLPAPVHGLLHRTKAVVAREGFKYTRSGAICVCKTDSSAIIVVKTEADFVNLQ